MKPDDDALPSAPGQAQDPAAFFRQLGEQTSKVLTAAEEAAREIRDQARRDAAEVLADVRMRAEELARAAAAERRIAEEELRRFREARAILANQIEDVRRRLEEIILRLRTPVDAPDTVPSKGEGAGGKPDGGAHRPEAPAANVGAAAAKGEAPTPPVESPALVVEVQVAKPEASSPKAGAASPSKAEPAALKAEAPALKAEPQPGRAVPPPPATSGGTRPAPPVPQVAQALPALEPQPADTQANLVTPPSSLPAQGGSTEAELAGRHSIEERQAAAVAGEAAAMARAEELGGEAASPRAPEAVQERLAPVLPPVPRPAPTPLVNGGVRSAGLTAPATLGLADFEPQVDIDEELPPGSPEAEAFRRRAEALGDIPLAAARSLKRLLQEDQNDLLDRIRRSRGRGTFEDILPGDVQVDRFGAGMRTVLEPAFLRGRTLGGAPNIGESPDPVGSLVAKQVVAPLRRDLARMIEPRLAAGDTVATVSERAGDVYRVWKGVRTELLGEGLAYAAFHHGLLEAWREGHVGGKRWVMSPDEADCPKDICRTNEAAGLVGLDSSFPSGHLVPPAHGACSCTVIAPAR